ncbi:LemA family protein [Salinibacter sp. 10B]|uniref:LemA family protein n=1 Tax=Salinibacter sp. 10B TaxID=1923971 RepID=UPI000CF4E3FA|nr:LemA family protein [Salinibacter sp. 10B]PQJ35177.1 LemA family protein [Salinibacter sp. 10B]
MRSKGTITLVILVVLLGLGGCGAASSYNTLVQSDESVKTAWSNLQAQYQRRADLIPNLVETVQGAADFEKETLQAVTEARAKATSIQVRPEDLDNPQKLQQFQQAQSALGQSLGRLLAVSENYPQLQATQAFSDLQAQLEGTENRITVARRDYNQAVQQYNTKVRSFPTVLFAGLMGFPPRTAFEAEAGAEQAPDVNFD